MSSPVHAYAASRVRDDTRVRRVLHAVSGRREKRGASDRGVVAAMAWWRGSVYGAVEARNAGAWSVSESSRGYMRAERQARWRAVRRQAVEAR